MEMIWSCISDGVFLLDWEMTTPSLFSRSTLSEERLEGSLRCVEEKTTLDSLGGDRGTDERLLRWLVFVN